MTTMEEIKIEADTAIALATRGISEGEAAMDRVADLLDSAHALGLASRASPEPGWAEGYRAGVESTRCYCSPDGDHLFVPGNDDECSHCGVSCRPALPVPPAPTPAPGAKHAESVTGWMTRSDAAALRLSFWGAVRVHRERPVSSVTVNAAVRVRVTVEPAPVEPEETHR